MSPTMLPTVLLFLATARLVAAAPLSVYNYDSSVSVSRCILGTSLGLLALILLVPAVFVVAEHIAGELAVRRFLHRVHDASPTHHIELHALPSSSCAACLPTALPTHGACAPGSNRSRPVPAEVANQSRESVNSPSAPNLSPRLHSTGRARTRQTSRARSVDLAAAASFPSASSLASLDIDSHNASEVRGPVLRGDIFATAALPPSLPYGTQYSNASTFDLATYADHAETWVSPVIERDFRAPLPPIVEEV